MNQIHVEIHLQYLGEDGDCGEVGEYFGDVGEC